MSSRRVFILNKGLSNDTRLPVDEESPPPSARRSVSARGARSGALIGSGAGAGGPLAGRWVRSFPRLRARKSLLLRVDRTQGGHHEIDASDPKRT